MSTRIFPQQKSDRILTDIFSPIPIQNVKFELSCPSVALESVPGPTPVAQCTNPVGAPPQKLELYTKFAIAQLQLRCIVLPRTYSLLEDPVSNHLRHLEM